MHIFFLFFCKIELHGQQNHNNKVISIPAYSAGSSWSAIFQILPLWNIFHCKILAVRYFHWSPWWLYNFQVWYYSSKKARQDPISPRQNWDNFREINAIGKMSRPPALGELHSPVPSVDWEIVIKTQSQLVWSFESQGVSKILRACRNFGKVNG